MPNSPVMRACGSMGNFLLLHFLSIVLTVLPPFCCRIKDSVWCSSQLRKDFVWFWGCQMAMAMTGAPVNPADSGSVIERRCANRRKSLHISLHIRSQSKSWYDLESSPQHFVLDKLSSNHVCSSKCLARWLNQCTLHHKQFTMLSGTLIVLRPWLLICRLYNLSCDPVLHCFLCLTFILLFCVQ